MRIRWSDNDRYFGPFTYACDSKYRKFAVMLGSGREEYQGCRLRISIGKHTLIAALPAVIKPWRQWVDTSRYEWSTNPHGGYFDEHEREYGFTFVEGALHLHGGAQTGDSTTDKSWVWFYPWREHRMVRHSVYDLKGDHFADLPQGKYSSNRFAADNALKTACPVARFDFLDFDGERITATCQIEEREWKRGKGLFRIIFLGRNLIRRSLDLTFSAEVGKRKGSWKGGTIGHSIDMLPDELHGAAFRRYCEQQKLKFVGPTLEEISA